MQMRRLELSHLESPFGFFDQLRELRDHDNEDKVEKQFDRCDMRRLFVFAFAYVPAS
jgi:hypothetical protein